MEHKEQTQPTSPSRRYSPPSTPKNLASGRRPRSRTTCGHDKFYKVSRMRKRQLPADGRRSWPSRCVGVSDVCMPHLEQAGALRVVDQWAPDVRRQHLHGMPRQWEETAMPAEA